MFQCAMCPNRDSFAEIKELAQHNRRHYPTCSPSDCTDGVPHLNCPYSSIVPIENADENSGNCLLYKCDKCDCSYVRSNDLNIHRRSHSGAMVFVCSLCDRMFAHSQNLSAHVRTTHKQSFEEHELDLIETVLANGCQTPPIDGNKDSPNACTMKPNLLELILSLAKQEAIDLPSSKNCNIHHLVTERRFKCPQCTLAFVKWKSLKIHCKRNHVGVRIPPDPDISNQHDIACSNQTLNCSICETNQTFETRSLLVAHLNDSHSGRTPFACTQCKLAFSTISDLAEHARHAHPADVDTTKIAIMKRVKCSYCGQTFSNSNSLTKHERRHIGRSTDGATGSGEATDTTVQCSVCSIPFSSAQFLDRHMRIHAQGKPHKCAFCEKRFAQSCDRVKHERIHTGERPFACDRCDKTFAHRTSQRKHALIHTGERSYQCTVCGKAFLNKSNLVVHMRSHTGERPYPCTICTKSFRTTGNLADHTRIHAGAKTRMCPKCPRSFLHNSSLLKHQRTMHSVEPKPYHCPVCDHRFSQAGHLKEHQRIHTGEKPYKCDECEKAFRRADALQAHQKTHAAAAAVVEAAIRRAEVQQLEQRLRQQQPVVPPACN